MTINCIAEAAWGRHRVKLALTLQGQVIKYGSKEEAKPSTIVRTLSPLRNDFHVATDAGVEGIPPRYGLMRDAWAPP